jgi:small subunit ribosomal protein S1
VVRGTVTSVRDFGAFVDIGGVDALIHVSELAHGRVAHPSEVLAVGQQIEAQVVKLEPDASGGRGRVGLSLRVLAPDPWASVADRFPVGTTVEGTVRRLEPFGAFVEIAPGIDGLIHVSRLSLDRRIAHPRQAVGIGDRVEVTVVEVDVEKRRLGLSMVEQARRARDAAEVEARRETEALLARPDEAKSLGTLADLLAASRPKR